VEKGDERQLEIGYGRGAVLLMAAQRLPRGRAVGGLKRHALHPADWTHHRSTRSGLFRSQPLM
jgi:hypothetical protein